MQFSLLIALLLVGSAQAQLSATRDQECKENETFTTCGSACEPSCDNQSPSFCTLQCVVGCQCDKGFYRKSAGACVTLAQCSTPVTAPPLPASNLTCPTNEEANACHNPCTEKKCPVANPPMVNCLLMCTNGCSCKKGYLRNMQGQCVKEAECPAVDSSENQCNLVDCRSGTSCKVQNGKAVCIPAPDEVPSSITCANVRCGSKGGCGMVEPAGCPTCKLSPQCLEVNMCHTTKCSADEECVLVQVTCVKAPCHPMAQCRPKKARLVKPLVQIREPRQSGPSCMTARCGTAAGCAMIKPMSCMHSKNCELRPACVEENACAATSCPVGSDCVLHEVQCIRAPCNPIAQCEQPRLVPTPINRRCRQNERFSTCKTSCADTNCNEEPRMCAQVCTGSGCVCQEGFYRNKRGQCVTQNDCDAEKTRYI